GWFIDATPSVNEEFELSADGAVRAAAGSDAFGRYDLQTVVAHELGHLLGFTVQFGGFAQQVTGNDDVGFEFMLEGGRAKLDRTANELDPNSYSNALMAATLSIGQRKSATDMEVAMLQMARTATFVDIESPFATTTAHLHADGHEGTHGGFVLLAEDVIEQLQVGASVGLTNGGFVVTEPNAAGFGWSIDGAVAMQNQQVTLSEDDSRLLSDLHQTFVIPDNAVKLTFTVNASGLAANQLLPPDAFEVALLNAITAESALPVANGLTDTDAILNLQEDGSSYFSSAVTIDGPLSGTQVDWSQPQNVTIDLANVEHADPVTLYFDLIGFGSTSSVVTLQNLQLVTDGGTAEPGIVVTPTSDLTTTEDGGTAQFTVVLTAQPTDVVLVPLFSSSTREGRLSAASLRFTPDNWDVPQTVVVTGQDDDLVDGDRAYAVITAWATSADRRYHGMNPADVQLINRDNDVALPQIVVNAASDLWTDEGGATAQFEIVLSAQPTADVTVPLSSTNTSEGIVSPAEVIFTASNWDQPQTITVTGVNDGLVDANANYWITTGWAVSADARYHGQDPDDVPVVNRIQQRPVVAFSNLDTNRDSFVTPIDALLVINELNRLSYLSPDEIRDIDYRLDNPRLDVNADGLVSPFDALLVINELNNHELGGKQVAVVDNADASDAALAGVDHGDLFPVEVDEKPIVHAIASTRSSGDVFDEIDLAEIALAVVDTGRQRETVEGE
ncbi:MAG: hypothetical protein KDB23_21245, partial [Planctomycetales bacterium]|nr:hypothetical protein [Planctomycetales bacterium]